MPHPRRLRRGGDGDRGVRLDPRGPPARPDRRGRALRHAARAVDLGDAGVRAGLQADHAEIGRALDAGAHGVVVPQIGSVAEAQLVARACRYAPTGARSIGPTRAKLYGRSDPLPADASVVCLPMIESRAGLEAAAAIADVEGVDGLFVGPADLALDLGVGGAELDDALRHVAQVCRDRGKLAGAFGMGAREHPRLGGPGLRVPRRRLRRDVPAAGRPCGAQRCAARAPAGRHTWMRSRIEMIPTTSPSRSTTR